MGFFNFGRKNRTSTVINWQITNGIWVSPSDNNDTYIDKGYKSIPNLYGIISLILQKSSIVPAEVFKVKNKAAEAKYKAFMRQNEPVKALKYKNEAYEKVEGSQLEELLLNPNKYQSFQEINEQIDGYKLLTGNSYLFGQGPDAGINSGKITELHCVPSPTVTIVAGDYRNPVKGYKISYLEGEIPKESMAHFKYWNPLTSFSGASDMLYGMPPLKTCRRLLGKYANADIAQGTMLDNMGPKGILTQESGGNMTQPQAEQIQTNFNDKYSGTKNAGKIAVTAAAVRWQQIGLSPVDLNIIESKEEMLGELCNVFHVPIGMFTKVNSTENNMIESRKMFITDAVIPLVEHRKAVLNRWLAPKFGDDLVIEYDYTVFAEMQEDLDKLADVASKMYWITPNEKRSLTGYDADENELMNTMYFPSGLKTIDDINAQMPEIDEGLLNE